jgi:hypothetical protein
MEASELFDHGPADLPIAADNEVIVGLFDVEVVAPWFSKPPCFGDRKP